MILTLRCEDLDLDLMTVELPIIDQSYIDKILANTTHESGLPITHNLVDDSKDVVLDLNNKFDILKSSILDLQIKKDSSDKSISDVAKALLIKIQEADPKLLQDAGITAVEAVAEDIIP